MNILLLGSGGREHALAWKMAQSPLLTNLFIAPGNAGTSRLGTNLPITVIDFTGIREAVLSHSIDMVVVGPEDPLVAGIKDFFLSDPDLVRVPVIGPSAAAARLEGSKDFAKAFMIRHGIPTAGYRTFGSHESGEAVDFLRTLAPPYVLKADGLAAGKGVVICPTLAEAEAEVTSMLRDGRFGEASRKVVIEEFLTGIELSVFIVSDGKNWLLLPEAKDYKKIGEGDTGPNTGGMGSVSPVTFADEVFLKKVTDRIIRPTMEGLRSEGIPYTGFLFIGLMNVAGDPFVIEYNCRLGDPETESILPRIDHDMVELMIAVAEGTLDRLTLHISPLAAVTVMLVSEGYPGEYTKGKEISGENAVAGSLVFHAGTRKDPATGTDRTSGGRVMAITTLDAQPSRALETTLRNAGRIVYKGKYFRRDIGSDLGF